MPRFFVKLIPPRPTFPAGITPEEREIMAQHAIYWREHMQAGKVIIFGPVFDPAGVFGVAVLQTETEAEAQTLAAADPALAIQRYELHPMQAVLPN